MEKDPLYEKAKKIVIDNKNTSASFLQRKLTIGYMRSANLLDQLEQGGVISEFKYPKGRKILAQ